MDMGTDMSGMTEMGGATMGGMMKAWLHFTRGDALFFMGWVPVSTGAVVGACIGLFLLAIVERWVSAMRNVMYIYWAKRANELVAARFTKLPDDSSATTSQKRLSNDTRESELGFLPSERPMVPSPRQIASLRRTTPFIPAHDFTRGVIHVCQAALGYALMLAVMTFHAGYIISIVLGLGAGEILFGRFGANGHNNH